MRAVRFCSLVALFLSIPASALAGAIDVQIEGGTVWFSRNDVRIPGDDGTQFNMLDLTGNGPDPCVRIYATYAFNDRHALRLTIAPLETDGTGTLTRSTTFRNTTFAANVPTKGTYRFNTYRLTYQWRLHQTERSRWSVGAAALVRDAAITLEQEGRKQSRDDLGLVPLLHLGGRFYCTEKVSIVLDLEGAWSPMGRALDAALKTRYDFDSGWHVSAGYRTLEGGADNDDVYTFAWLHTILLETGYKF